MLRNRGNSCVISSNFRRDLCNFLYRAFMFAYVIFYFNLNLGGNILRYKNNSIMHVIKNN